MSSTTSTDPAEARVPPEPDLDGVHDLFWAVRHDRRIVEAFGSDPGPVLDEYEVDPALRPAVAALDVRALHLAGVNPYLLFFAALELGVGRDQYYERISTATDGAGGATP